MLIFALLCIAAALAFIGVAIVGAGVRVSEAVTALVALLQSLRDRNRDDSWR